MLQSNRNAEYAVAGDRSVGIRASCIQLERRSQDVIGGDVEQEAPRLSQRDGISKDAQPLGELPGDRGPTGLRPEREKS